MKFGVTPGGGGITPTFSVRGQSVLIGCIALGRNEDYCYENRQKVHQGSGRFLKKVRGLLHLGATWYVQNAMGIFPSPTKTLK